MQESACEVAFKLTSNQKASTAKTVVSCGASDISAAPCLVIRDCLSCKLVQPTCCDVPLQLLIPTTMV